MTIDTEQFHQVFFDESEEHLETMERLLMEIDPASPDPEALNSIFRAAHSIKGGSGIFGFDGLGGLTHVMENLLDKARKGQQDLSADIINHLLHTTDLLKTILDDYRSGNAIDQPAIDQAIRVLEETIDNGASKETKDEHAAFGFFEQPGQQDDNDDAFGFFDDTDNSKGNDASTAMDEAGFGFFDDTAPSEPSRTPPAPPPAASPSPASQAKKAPLTESKSIRVDTSKVDLLVNLIGELVITQSMLNVVGKSDGPVVQDKLEQGLAELERNTRELQEAVMSMRMLPISFVFNRFPRLVRDLADKLGKQVDLHIEGGSTEIDKGLIEKLVDPLTHLVRNSIDHGIERPDVRTARGKTKSGNITLAAAQRGGNIVISIRDDGAGLNKQKILAKAQQNNLPLPDPGNHQAIWELIFAPGFSTAETVTDVSGRGVGMDVVKRNIESMGGRISIASSEGHGSCFDISVPLTLAIVDGMCVASGEQVFVVPLVAIIESIQPAASQLRTIAKDNLLWVRDRYWPILNLSRRMEIDGAIQNPTDAIIILIESSKKRFGLMVDRLLGQQQVVIKSLEQHYRRVPGAAGATIMGDGHVAIILDVESLAEDVNTEVAERQTHEQTSRQHSAG
ncbi:chemotaxis protein CheA [Alteromonas sp. CYL-A6]|uniref:chemotaxis protein CheA n=1 Tax=Alteromonas nitratireducens TaxID=3390813 RepID=UPI0034C33A21